MHINILTLDYFLNLNIEAERSKKNTGGGMACLMNAFKACLSNRYRIHYCTEVSQFEGDVVIIDGVYVACRAYEGMTHHAAVKHTLDLLKKDSKKYPRRKYLLWCAEKSLIRMIPDDRFDLLKLVEGVVVTDPYIYQLFEAIGVIPMGYLCDAIDTDLFRPNTKQMTVTAVGGLKHIKNIDWILEVYALLEGKMHRTYFGSADLWSRESRKEDLVLVEKIKAVTDNYYPNASPVQVAYHNGRAAFAVNNTWHDCSSRANEELLAGGVISIHGQHSAFKPRPGFTVRTPQEAVAKIAELTADFTQLPDPVLHQASRDWAVAHVSEKTFIKQFERAVGVFL